MQQLRGLCSRECEVGGPDLGECALGAQPVQREPRIGPAHGYQSKRRRVTQQRCDPGQHLRIADLSEVVEHERKWPRQFGQPHGDLA